MPHRPRSPHASSPKCLNDAKIASISHSDKRKHVKPTCAHIIFLHFPPTSSVASTRHLLSSLLNFYLVLILRISLLTHSTCSPHKRSAQRQTASLSHSPKQAHSSSLQFRESPTLGSSTPCSSYSTRPPHAPRNMASYCPPVLNIKYNPTPLCPSHPSPSPIPLTPASTAASSERTAPCP